MTDGAKRMDNGGPIKRSITIAGHRTSLSLEQEFWIEIKTLADQQGQSIAQLIKLIDKNRGRRNLSSACRIYVLEQLKSQSSD